MPSTQQTSASELDLEQVVKQRAAVKVPAMHELVPVTEYPSSHVGWHEDPLANEPVQLPTPPLVGAVEASHEVVLAVDDIGGDAPHRDKLLTCGANDIHWLCSP